MPLDGETPLGGADAFQTGKRREAALQTSFSLCGEPGEGRRRACHCARRLWKERD